MCWSIVITIGCVATGFGLPRANPDPASLRATPEQLTAARMLISQLNNPSFARRETAQRELLKLGRVALPTIASTIDTTPHLETRIRCELLMPMIEEEDLRERLRSFLADQNDLFQHGLNGWTEFRAIAGNSQTARELFAEFWRSKSNALIFNRLNEPKDELAKYIVARRIELYNQTMRYTPGTTRVQPTLTEIAGLIFLESLVPNNNDRRYYYVVSNLLMQPAAREALQDAKKGPIVQKLVVQWMDTREDSNEMSTALNIVANLNLKEVSIGRYAQKILDSKTATGYVKMNALCSAARVGGKAELTLMQKGLKDESAQRVFWGGANGVNVQSDVQVRDIALVMSLILTEQKLEDYKVDVRNLNGVQNEAIRYNYYYYRFETDDDRTFALKKWNEWVAKNPIKPSTEKATGPATTATPPTKK